MGGSRHSTFKVVVISAVVAVAVSMIVCPRSRPRPIATLINWFVRLAPIAPLFFDSEEEPEKEKSPQYESSQHMLANQDPEPQREAGQIVLNHGHGW